MKRTATTLTLTATLLLGACGGGDALPDIEAIEQFEECLGTGLDELLGSVGGLASLLAVASDPESAEDLGLTWTAATPTVYNFSLPIDLDGDQVPDGRLEGTATFDRDPSGGLLLEDKVHITWDVTGVPDLTGIGDIYIQLGAEDLALWGEIKTSRESGQCTFEFLIDELEPLSIRIDGVWPPAPSATLPVAGYTAHFIGNGRILLILGSEEITADAQFSPDGNTLHLANIRATDTSLGLPSTFNVDLTPGPAPNPGALAAWVGTWQVTSVHTSFITQNVIARDETWVFSVRNADSLNVAVTDNNVPNDAYSFVLVLDPGSTTKGAFIYQSPDAVRFDLGSGVATLEDRGTLELFNDGTRTRLLMQSSFGEPGFNQTNVEGFGSISASTKSP